MPFPFPQIGTIPPYAQFTTFTPAIPSFYIDVPSVEQRFLELVRAFYKQVCYSDTLADAINGNSEALNALQEQFIKFMESGFDDYYAEQIEQWVHDNAERVIKELLGVVNFGLTLDGYFVANVSAGLPITFDTVMDYSDDNYGCLEIYS